MSDKTQDSVTANLTTEQRIDRLEAILEKKLGAAAIHPEDEHRLEMAQAAQAAEDRPAAERVYADDPRLAGTEVGANKTARAKDWGLAEEARQVALAGVTPRETDLVTGQAVGVKPDTTASTSDDRTLEDLQKEASDLDIKGRSSMNKDELAAAIADKRGDTVPA